MKSGKFWLSFGCFDISECKIHFLALMVCAGWVEFWISADRADYPKLFTDPTA